MKTLCGEEITEIGITPLIIIEGEIEVDMKGEEEDGVKEEEKEEVHKREEEEEERAGVGVGGIILAEIGDGKTVTYTPLAKEIINFPFLITLIHSKYVIHQPTETLTKIKLSQPVRCLPNTHSQ